jgi:uncharacterized protein DUF5990
LKRVGPGRGQRPASERVPVPIRITLLGPPPGVDFCIQGHERELLQRTRAAGQDLSFDLTVLAARVEGMPRFFGDVVQGPPAGRFVYVCSGTLAGQSDSCWTRRAKVPLGGITWESVERVLAGPAARLEARFEGRTGDGGPACATIKLLDRGWRLIP